MNKQPNLGWLFYRKAFDSKKIQWKEWLVDKKEDSEPAQIKFEKEIFKELVEHSVIPENDSQWETYLESLRIPEANQTFLLTTTYPGLLIGAGYAHEMGLKEEFKLGFYFDHTTGLPVIPGSSVKGALRSAFPNSGKKRDSDKAKFIFMLLEEVNKEMEEEGIPVKSFGENRIDDLEYEIFEGKKFEEEKSGEKQKQKFLSIYQRDVFYEAYIVHSTHPGRDGKTGHILGNDYITPHKHTGNPRRPELDAFSNPTPLQFLKVLPEVTFCFQFRLHNGIISAEQKKRLFQKILLTLGIGAKTNVGYGQFVVPENKG